jgi:HNH endonuclease
MSERGELTAERLRELLHYDPETGVFIRRVAVGRHGRCRAGTVAGRGVGEYRGIGIERKTYTAHRLAWLWVTGKWPECQIDHINCDPADNRWCNLREATQSQNQANRRVRQANNTSGFNGVRRYKGSKGWHARIRIEGEEKYLGCFNYIGLAMFVYNFTAWHLNGEFARLDPEFLTVVRQRHAWRNLASHLAAPQHE